ncbi:hypothetical protein MNBD_GAMMA03-1925 [hydrothermal vent metagenome]|uniref:DUF218 domain-containing protein n=1 Tax=hydrothermal vent metagenome TaxID=652676 RepID=A0A3B0W2I4_9ZZZZ
MLFLSVLWGVCTLGFAWVFQFWRVINTSKSCVIQSSLVSSSCWIVFGKQLQNNQIDDEYRQRLDRLIESAPLLQPHLVVLQGGVTQENSISEAEAGQAYLQSQQAFNLNFKLILEASSRNTLENLKQTRYYLEAHQLDLKVCLVSNRYHLHRCAVMAENLGFEITLLPAEKSWALNYKQVSKVVLEAFLLNWYWTGRMVSQLLKNQRMLDKIQ